MPGATVPLGYPYPLPADAPDTPGYLEAFARAVDTSVDGFYTQAATAAAPPAAKATGTAQVIANNVTTFLSFSAAPFDNAGMVDLTASPTGLVIPAGATATTKFSMIGVCQFANNATGFRRLELTVGGTVFSRWESAAATGGTFPTTARCGLAVPAAAGTVIRLQATQNSGGNLTVLSCSLSIFRYDD